MAASPAWVPWEIKPITWHYTHRNLLPQIIWRESKHKHISSFGHSWDGLFERRRRVRMRRKKVVAAERIRKSEGRSEGHNVGEWRWDTVSERVESSNDGAGRRAFCLFLPPCLCPPRHSKFSAFESRGSRGFPGKDVHRFLLLDRPFEQQPTWQSEPYYA